MPKDPFLEPHAFVQVLYSLHTSRLFSSFPPPPSPAYFTYEAVRLIDRAYGKYRQSEAYKPHRVLLNKLDDLTTDLRTSASSGGGGGGGDAGRAAGAMGGGHANSHAHTAEATSDLSAFVRLVVAAGGKEGAASLRYLWTGRLVQLVEKRREKVGSDGEWDWERERERGRDKERERERDKDEVRNEGTDGKSTEDEGEAKRWRNGRRVQRKIESWTSG